MQHTISEERGRLVVRLTGRVTFTDAPLFPAIVKAIGSTNAAECEFDVGGVEFVDSTGLTLFLLAHDAARTRRCRLILSNARASVADLLTRTRLPELWAAT